MGSIQVTLLSDLCAGSGKGFSNVVDTDITIDPYGLPYIPARRMKGCLREAAEYIDVPHQTVDAIFGVAGDVTGGALTLGNGYLPRYQELADGLKHTTKAPPQAVTELFTSVWGQTAITEEIKAKKNTLRTIRVLNRHMPYGDEHESTRFCFRAECARAYEPELIRICKALRSIGMNRTRGLGDIQCEYIETPCEDGNAHDVPNVGARALKLVLRLNDPLQIAAASDEQCAHYVPGAALLGAMTRLYIAAHPERKDMISANHDAVFDQLFLSGAVSYGNLYISDLNGEECVPAPAFLGKIKSPHGTRDGCLATTFEDNAGFENAAGFEVKPLRAAMVSRQLEMRDVLTETVYHHSVSGSQLYTQSCIQAGQFICGFIRGDAALLTEIRKLLSGGVIRLGRSKSAQYASCGVVSCEPSADDQAPTLHLSSGEQVVFALESDVILQDERGVNTVEPMALLRALLPGGDCSVLQDAQNGMQVFCQKGTSVSYKVIHGYNGKRNLRNVPSQAFAMGSILSVKVGRDGLTLPRTQVIGGRTDCGFGVVRVYKLNEIAIAKEQAPAQTRGAAAADTGAFRDLLRAVAGIDKARAVGRRVFDQNEKALCGLSSSFVGRVMLMVQQADKEQDLIRRVQSVKNADYRGVILKVLERKGAEQDAADGGFDWRVYMLTLLSLTKYALKKKLSKEADAHGG